MAQFQQQRPQVGPPHWALGLVQNNVKQGEIMLDLIKTVKAQLYDRITSPLLGSFALSWLGWNYRFVIVIFSSMKPSDKMVLINYLYASHSDIYLKGLLFPLLTALFLIFIYPYPARWAYAYWKYQQRKLKEIQQKNDDKNEEARELRLEILKKESEFLREIDQRNKEITSLKAVIDQLQGYIEKLGPSSVLPSIVPEDNLNKRQFNVLRLIERNEHISEDNLIGLFSDNDDSRLSIKYDLDELRKRSFITWSDGLITTPQGREYIVKNKVIIPLEVLK